MIRKIIQINEDKCNGCGLCANACHEGAIGIVNGKATLLRDDYCDGMGDCLPNCPTGAITFTEREALAYDHEAVQANMKAKKAASAFTANAAPAPAAAFSGCPGSRIQMLHQDTPAGPVASAAPVSQLRNWPVQIKLAPITAPYFDGAQLLIAADCTAYAYANFHQEFIRGKVTLIGCPKLDSIDYSEKLAAILETNNIQSVTVVRMQVPCCGGLEMATRKALQQSGKELPWQVVTISMDGKILE